MKKIVFILSALVLLGLTFNSCEPKESEDTHCWVIEAEHYTTTTEHLDGYPKTTYTVIEKCGITRSEAQRIANENNGKITTGDVTVVTTCRIFLKSEYKPRKKEKNKGTGTIKLKDGFK